MVIVRKRRNTNKKNVSNSIFSVSPCELSIKPNYTKQKKKQNEKEP